MSLNLTKLENYHEGPDKATARCPACAEKGQDHTGDHLVIYADGKYGCVAHQNDPEHSRAIFRLVGVTDNEAGRGPIPVVIRRPACALRKPRTLRTLFSNFYANSVRDQEGDHNYKESGKTPSEASELDITEFLRLLPFMEEEFRREPVFGDSNSDDDDVEPLSEAELEAMRDDPPDDDDWGGAP